VFQAGFSNFSGEPLRDLSGLGNAASLSYQSGNIFAGRNIPAFFQWLNMKPDCYRRHAITSF
jgi:hypothetical protein